ncbi:hypothetical protein D3C86_1735300 [compost metagenome]
MLFHQTHRGASAKEGAIDGSGEVGVPVGGGHGVDAAPGVGHRIVDQNVQATVSLRGGFQCTDVGLLIADVGHGNFSAPAQSNDFFLHPLQRLHASPAEHDGGALLGEPQRGGLTDARTGAGHKGDFSL